MGVILGPDSKPIELLGSPVTAEYRSQFDLSQFMSISVKRNPVLTLMKMEEMLLDPFIRLGLSFKKAPVRKATIIVKAKDRAVREWVATNLRRFWRLPLRKMMRGYEYGFAGFEVLNELAEDVEGNKKIHFKGLKDFQPRDTTPLTFEGKIAGVRVKCPTTSSGSMGGNIDLIGPKALWYAHDMRAGNWFGRSVFLGCQSTYEELNGKDCAKDSRFHWYYRHAFRGPTIRYPTQMYVKPGADGQNTMLSGRDMAMEMAVLGKNGASIVLPNTRDPANQSEYLFPVDWPQQSTSSGMDIREYVKDLRNEEWNGLELPDEIISADGTGALAGRRVPERAFYSSCEDDLNEIIDWLVIQWMQPVAFLNYGRDRGQFELQIGEIAPAQEAPGDNKEGEPGEEKKDPLADWLGGANNEGTNDDPEDGGEDPEKPPSKPPGGKLSKITQQRVQQWRQILEGDELAMIRGEVVVSRAGRVQLSVPIRLSTDGQFNIPIAGQTMLDAVTKIASQRAMFLSNELKTKLLRLAARNPNASPQEFMRAAARLIAQIQPRLAALVRDTIVAGWVMGAKRGSLHIPKDVQADLAESATGTTASTLLDDLKQAGAIQERVQSVRVAFYHPGENPSVNFPGVDEAFADLQSRHILDAADYYKLGDQARAAAFTVSYVNGTDTLDMIRNKLADAVSQGTTKETFATAIGDAMDASPLGESHLETVFRNNTQSAASAGQETVINDPLVIEAFPYAIYEGIEDTRQRDTHNAVMRAGIPIDGEGSNIFRSDDPFWNIWTPPNGHRCRCGKTYITLRQAARLGVPEAKRWIETGTPPANPWYTKTTLQPDPGFAHRPSIGGSSAALSRPVGQQMRSHRTMILRGHVYQIGDPLPAYALNDMAVIRYFAPVRLSTVHAPPGGITVNGTEYKGGQFIPSGSAGAAKSAAKETVGRVKGAWDGSNFHAASVKTKKDVLKDLGYAADDADELARSIDASDPTSGERLYDEAFHAAPIHKLADADIDEESGDEMTADKLNGWWSHSPDHFLDQLENRLHAEGVKSLKVTSIASEAADLVEAGEADKAAELISKALPERKPVEKDGAPAPAAKEPWQMTAAEWSEEFERDRPSGQGGHKVTAARNIGKSASGPGKDFAALDERRNRLTMGLPDTDSDSGLPWADSQQEGLQVPPRHRQVIEHAIATGHDVPAEVLAEYPDLAKKKGPAKQVSLFTREDLTGERQLFDTGRDFVKDKPSTTKPPAAPSELEKIADEQAARSRENSPLPGQKELTEADIEVGTNPVGNSDTEHSAAGPAPQYQKGFHAKANSDTHVIRLTNTVPRDEYLQIAAVAKEHGGYYSTFSRDGAVPGFQFKTEADARGFMEAIGGETAAAGTRQKTAVDVEALRQTAADAERKALEYAESRVKGAGYTKSAERTQKQLDRAAEEAAEKSRKAERRQRKPVEPEHVFTDDDRVPTALQSAEGAAKYLREDGGTVDRARYDDYAAAARNLDSIESGYAPHDFDEWKRLGLHEPAKHAESMGTIAKQTDVATQRANERRVRESMPEFVDLGGRLYKKEQNRRGDDEYQPVPDGGASIPVSFDNMLEHVKGGRAKGTTREAVKTHVDRVIDDIKAKASAADRAKLEAVEAKVKAELNRPATQVISENAPPDGWKESDKVPADPKKVRHQLAVAAHGDPWKHTEKEWQQLAGGDVGYQYGSAVAKAIAAGDDVPDNVVNQEGHSFRVNKAHAEIDRQFTPEQHELMRKPAHELTEAEYLQQNKLTVWRNSERNAIGWQRQQDELGPKQTKKRAELQSNVDYWKKAAAELRESKGESEKQDSSKEYQRGKYREAVKQAISKGLVTDATIIDQYPEFRLARDARERYEKGRHTSFANKSIAIDDSMREVRGYKAKRQDGKPMTPDIAKYLSDGVAEVERVVGPLADLFKYTDVTLAHTAGKHPFLSTAGGLYHPSEKTVTSGIAVGGKGGIPVKALAHELGHWLDDEAGVAAGKSTSVMHYTFGNNAKGKRIESSKVSEANERLASKDAERTELFDMATRMINDVQEVKRLTKTKYGDAKNELDKIAIEKAKVTLGPYWRTPAEVWARLFEQYVADELSHDPKLVSAESDYHNTPGWWKKEDFARLKPLVKKEIEKRLGMLRAAATKAKGEGQ